MFDQSVRVLAPHRKVVLGHMRRINDGGIVMGSSGLSRMYSNERGIVIDFYRRGGRLDLDGLADELVRNNIIPVAQRMGIEAARRKFGFYEEGLPADYPLQRIEMDEWQIDLARLLGDSGALDGLRPEDRAKLEVGRRWIYVAMILRGGCRG